MNMQCMMMDNAYNSILELRIDSFFITCSEQTWPKRMGLEEAECEVGVHNCHRGECQSLLAQHMMEHFTPAIMVVLLVAA